MKIRIFGYNHKTIRFCIFPDYGIICIDQPQRFDMLRIRIQIGNSVNYSVG